MPRIAAVKGTHDVLPGEASAWEWLLAEHARVTGLHGYRPVETPVLEHTELFQRGIGTGTDVVDKEMFTFVDRGERSVTLRPEGTAGVLRAVLDAALTQETRPVRVHYAGPMFRYDQPQHGRYRQFAQVGVEAVGDPSPHLDAEVVELAVRFVTALGIEGVTVQLNSLGDADDRARYRSALTDYYTPLADSLCEDCAVRLRVNPLRLLDCKRDRQHVDAAPLLEASLSDESRAHLATVLTDLEAAGIAVVRNHRLVRGLDYYAHTAFELWHPSLRGAQNALGGGGRYDGLAEELGYAATPGVGYALGIERLLIVATEVGSVPSPPPAADVVAIALDGPRAASAAAAARLLRDLGLRVVLDAGERRPGAKLKAASRLGAAACILVGEQEEATGTVGLKDLATGNQISVSLAALPTAVRAILDARSNPA